MTNHEPKCPACRMAMEEGFLLDRGHHSTLRQAEWVAGAPEKSFWSGLKTKDRAVIPIVSYRCPACGLLASFATGGSPSGSA
jgi:Domain of unknown function (DUF6487)